MTEGISSGNPTPDAAPTRDRFRAERQEQRRRKAERRRKLIRVPAVVLGVAMIAAGAWKFFDTNDATVPPPPADVGGTSIVRTTTTAAPAIGQDPSVTDVTADPGAQIPVVGGDATQPTAAPSTAAP